MYKAYVLIKVVPHKENEILRELSKIPAVIKAHKLFGQFDLIVEIEQKSMRQLMDSVSRIRGVKSVLETITNLVADFDIDV